jgi:acetyl-CoA/propionyl-CoA carboxylase biotin carboxyl carrier protein
VSAGRQRISVPSAQLVVQPAAEDIAGFAGPKGGESVIPIAPTAADRRAGRRRLEVVVDGWRFEVTTEPAARAELRDKALRAAAEHQVAVDVTLRAQIPGRIARLWVADGEQVEQGQRLLAIEAMKMENEIRAPHAGTVTAIRVEVGARVERDDELLTVAQ